MSASGLVPFADGDREGSNAPSFDWPRDIAFDRNHRDRNPILAAPSAATRSFGLPLPGEGPTIAPWLRLKGVRDIASGLAVLVSLIWGSSFFAGVILLALVTIPIGDMFVVLMGNGSTKSALGIHGVTAIVMIVTGILLL